MSLFFEVLEEAVYDFADMLFLSRIAIFKDAGIVEDNPVGRGIHDGRPDCKTVLDRDCVCHGGTHRQDGGEHTEYSTGSDGLRAVALK